MDRQEKQIQEILDDDRIWEPLKRNKVKYNPSKMVIVLRKLVVRLLNFFGVNNQYDPTEDRRRRR